MFPFGENPAAKTGSGWPGIRKRSFPLTSHKFTTPLKLPVVKVFSSRENCKNVGKGFSGRRENLGAVKEGRSYEDLSEMSGSAWFEAFAQVGESPDLDPGIFGKGESFGEVLMSGVVVLEPVS